MIKIQPLGVNGAFTKYYHNNYVFELGERKLLVDAGTTLRSSLPVAGYIESDITDIFITHLHSDHVGGLEEFAQRCKFIHNHKPTLWIRKDLVGDLLNYLKNGLCTDGFKIDDYLNLEFVEDEFELESTKESYSIELIKTDSLHAKEMLSTALKINDIKGDINIVFSSDIAKHEEAQLNGVFDQRTVALFHDVSLVKNPVHSYIKDVVDYYKEKIDLGRVYAMHYQDDIDIEENEKKYGIEFIRSNRYYIFY